MKIMETTCSVNIIPHIAIIESPNASDVAAGRIEGEALSAALRVMGVKNNYYPVANLAEIDRCMAQIVVDAKITPGPIANFPNLFVHLSMHGNMDGIELTESTFIPWLQLGDKLLDVARASGRIFPEENAGILTVCFSTCYGLYGGRMAAGRPQSPYLGIVGAKNKPTWSDAMTAFIAFYNHMYQPGAEMLEGVKRMNASIGAADLFQCRVAPQVVITKS